MCPSACKFENCLLFRFKSGVISKEKFYLFERILFRVTRGNLFMKHAEIDETIRDPISCIDTVKVVFIVFYQVYLFLH